MGERRLETATLAGGCFWCLDGAYRDLRGVIAVESGYAGGQVVDPTYEQVCRGTTGHAEVVRRSRTIRTSITYRDLLEVFFSIHDPTTLNRQGADVGSQYRSAIFHHDDAQREVAEAIIAELETRKRVRRSDRDRGQRPWMSTIQERVYHQDYYRNNPGQGLLPGRGGTQTGQV